MFRLITTLMLICALTISACDDEKKVEADCEEAPVAAVEAPDAGEPAEEVCEGDDCEPVEAGEPVEAPVAGEEDPVPEPEVAGVEPVEEPVEECPEEGCEEPAPEAGEEAPEVDPPIPG